MTPPTEPTPTCTSVHWDLPVECTLPRAHRANWHVGGNPLTGTWVRWRFPIRATHELVDGDWRDLTAPAAAAADEGTVPPTGQPLNLDEIEAAARNAARIGSGIHPDTALTLAAEIRRLRAVLEEIRHLHKDSPMGPCPVCIDADAAAAGGDGLVPYPCPTGRLAGAQDCDPPSFRAAARP